MKYCSNCTRVLEEYEIQCPHCGCNTLIMVPVHHLLPGTILGGRFVVGAALGEGGFGITYIGWDKTLDMKVAIKEYYPNGYVNRTNTISANVISGISGEREEVFDSGKERFLHEARILAKFSGNPGVVDVRDFFEENNTAYIVMEYLNGEDLKSYLNRVGTLTPEQAIGTLMPIMKTLTKIHAQGLIHRDISPDNIRLVEEGIKLMDFGAARNMSLVSNKSLSVMLKPGYAPEEQYRSRGEQGAWTDVYALCATIYKCITGITPDDSTQRAYNDELQTPTALGIPMHPVWEAALMKGLSVRQSDRYQSVSELIAGFEGRDAQLMQATASAAVDSGGHAGVGTNASLGAKLLGGVKVAGTKKNGKGKIILPIIIACVLGIAAIAAISSTLRKTTIANETIRKDETGLHLYNKTITAEDMQKISAMDRLESLSFSECAFDGNIIGSLGNTASPIKRLEFSSCTGVESLKGITGLTELTTLEISAVGLTDEKLKEIDFSNKPNLSLINFSENEQLSDLSGLAEIADSLKELDVSGTMVRDFSFLENCEKLTAVVANGTGMGSLDYFKQETLLRLEVNDNEITDISAIGNLKKLQYFFAEGNNIRDISALSTTPALIICKLSDNQIASLKPLSECTKLKEVHVSGNKLTNLDGLEKAIELQRIQAAENEITNLDGLVNCTILQEVNLNHNQLTDISLLAKSAATLEKVFLNYNEIEDISPLAGTTALKYLNLDFNKVTNLDALSESTELISILAEGNKITSIEGIKNATGLQYIFLGYNQLDNTEVIANLIVRAQDDIKVIDVSNNNIVELELTGGKSIDCLAVHNNPFTSLHDVGYVKGRRFLFTYVKDEDYTRLKDSFTYYDILECPLDQQLAVKEAIAAMGITHITAEEATAAVRERKTDQLTGEITKEAE